MDGKVEVTIPVDERAAAMLNSAHNREVIGRHISRLLNPRDHSRSSLSQAIADIKADARAAGLTDQDVDAELAAHKAERRKRQSA